MTSIPLTTVGIVPLHAAPSEEEESSSQLPSAFATTLSSLRALPGVTQLVWALQKEARHKLTVLIDWADETTFQQSSSEAQELLTDSNIFAASPPPLIFTAHFDGKHDPPGKTEVRDAPVTELVLHYFAASPKMNDDERKEVTHRSGQFTGRLYEDLPSILSFTSGWQRPKEQPLDVESAMVPDGKATIFIKFLGWPSVEEHMKVRQTKAFQIQLPDLKLGAVGGEMKHVVFRKVEKA